MIECSPPKTDPPGYWEQNQSGPVSWPSASYPVRSPPRMSFPCPINHFLRQDVQASYHPGANLAETESNLTGRFHPYAHRTRTTRHANAEAGPPTVALPYVQSGGQQIPEPSGGVVSETSADAETNQLTTEQHEAPVSNFYRARTTHATKWFFSVAR